MLYVSFHCYYFISINRAEASPIQTRRRRKMHYKITAGSCELRIHAQRQIFCLEGPAQKGDACGLLFMDCELLSAWTVSCPCFGCIWLVACAQLLLVHDFGHLGFQLFQNPTQTCCNRRLHWRVLNFLAFPRIIKY